MRPRRRPDLLLDPRFWLAPDRLNAGQVAECARAAAELITELEDSDGSVSSSATRIADALAVRAFALRRDGRLGASAAVSQELQARFAGAAEPGARESAVAALDDLVGFQLRALDIDAAILTAEEIVTRFDAETDSATVTELGGWLNSVFDRMLRTRRPERVRALAALTSCTGTESLVIAAGRRPRVRPIADELRRLKCAATVNARIADRFADDPDPRRHAMYLTTILARGAVLASHGHFARAARTLQEFSELGASAVSAIVDTAQPIAPGRYPFTAWGAAFMGSSVDLGTGPEADRTRSAIRRIMCSATVSPGQARRTAWIADRWMAEEARRARRPSRWTRARRAVQRRPQRRRAEASSDGLV